MQLIFAPTISLMSRLKYPAKFAVLGLLAVFAIGFLLLSLITGQSATIRLATNERIALELIAPDT